MKISKDKFIYIINNLGQAGYVSQLTVKNAELIFDGHFSDKEKLCSRSKQQRIDFTTEFNNMRFIFEELLKHLFKERMSWKGFLDKHALLRGKETHSNYKNTRNYKELAKPNLSFITDNIRMNIIKNPE
jgi:hypothetical protein